MIIPPDARFDFDCFEPLPIRIEVSGAPLSSEAGLVPLRQFDQRIGWTKQFAAALDDSRDPDLIEHSFSEMVRMRIFGILAGYEHQNDHDTLRTDDVFKLIADRSPTAPDLASQPTLSRFENQINIASLNEVSWRVSSTSFKRRDRSNDCTGFSLSRGKHFGEQDKGDIANPRRVTGLRRSARGRGRDFPGNLSSRRLRCVSIRGRGSGGNLTQVSFRPFHEEI
jgi:hypothetical protein